MMKVVTKVSAFNDLTRYDLVVWILLHRPHSNAYEDAVHKQEDVIGSTGECQLKARTVKP